MVTFDLVFPAWQFKGLPPDWPGGFWWHFIVFSIIILAFVLTLVIMFIWFERRTLGRMQARMGPNRVGPFGLLQAMADAIKVMLKEDIVPNGADKLVHLLAPLVAFVPVLMVFAVMPFQDGAALVNLNIGVLYVMAVSSISTLGIFMAGWGSNNKYTLISAMRDVASVVSYEIPVVLSLAGIVLLAGSLSLNDIVRSQAQSVPFVLLQPLGFIVFFLGGMAEINRSPFDLLEADSEIVAGFHTEYSGMKFALFYLAEYAEALVLSTLVATFFLGGWGGPLLPPWLWLIVKSWAVFFVLVWIRATVPRVRIDQLMTFSWKFLFPLALLNLVVTAVEVVAWPEALPVLLIPVNIAVGAVLVILLSRNFKPGGSQVEA
ncbi:MAG: NADH-quinone oxidoreductase subunit NuoH [Chloroflexi bacterium]|nr:NADH-quinone oxidoreductase subunit NuoH [Chloroflexota bacterium]